MDHPLGEDDYRVYVADFLDEFTATVLLSDTLAGPATPGGLGLES